MLEVIIISHTMLSGARQRPGNVVWLRRMVLLSHFLKKVGSDQKALAWFAGNTRDYISARAGCARCFGSLLT
jgi:hypothetical protein